MPYISSKLFLTFTLALLFFYNIIVEVLYRVFNYNSSYLSVIILSYISLFTIFSIYKYKLFDIDFKIIFLFFILIIYNVFTYWFEPLDILINLIYLYFFSFTFYIFGACYSNFTVKFLYKLSKYVSLLSFILLIILIFYPSVTISRFLFYGSDFLFSRISILCAICSLIIYCQFYKNNNLFYLFLLSLNIYTVFLLGYRFTFIALFSSLIIFIITIRSCLKKIVIQLVIILSIFSLIIYSKNVEFIFKYGNIYNSIKSVANDYGALSFDNKNRSLNFNSNQYDSEIINRNSYEGTNYQKNLIQNNSIVPRLFLLNDAFHSIKENLLLGSGFNSFWKVSNLWMSKDAHPHNVYIQLFSDFGIPLALIIIFIFFNGLINLRYNYPLYIFSLFIFIYIMVNSSFYREGLLWLALGFSYKLKKFNKKSQINF